MNKATGTVLLITLGAASLAAAGLTLAPAELLIDLNTNNVTVDSSPHFPCGSQIRGFFSAIVPGTGVQLWRTDGTSPGTRRLTAGVNTLLNVRNCAMRPADGVVFFEANTATHGAELWRSDGTTEGTRIVVDLVPGPDSSRPVPIGSIAERIIFLAETPNGFELWATRAGDIGADLLREFGPASATSVATGFQSAAIVYFGAESPGLGMELWATDGTPAGTRQIRDINPGAAGSAPSFLWTRPDSGLTMFAARTQDAGLELWRTDGTEAGTWMIGDINPGPSNGISGTIIGIGETRVVFRATDGATSRMWSSDGSPGGTYPLLGPEADLVPVTGSGQWARTLGERMVFIGTTALNGRELWSTDGTVAGTFLLTDITAGAADSDLQGHDTAAAAYTLFSVADAAGGREPWITDGSVAGTRALGNLTPGTGSTFIRHSAYGAASVYFASTESLPPDPSAQRYSLWKYSLGAASPVLASELETNLLYFGEVVDDRLLFAMFDRQSGTEPWVSDGTVAGTGVLLDIGTQTRTHDSAPQPFAAIGSIALMSATDATPFHRGLWRTDGTAAGTFALLHRIEPAYAGHFNATLPGNRVLFPGLDGSTGDASLWVTDGTAGGTWFLRSFQPSNAGAFGCRGRTTAVVNGFAVFGGSGDDEGMELWRSDGTAAGTTRIADLAAGFADSLPCHFAELDGYAYFAATVDDDAELWRTNGTAEGTERVADIRSNGSSSPSELVAWRNRIYFFATGDSNTREVWSTDGSNGGTRVLTNVVPVSGISMPMGALTVAGNYLYFGACHRDGAIACRLWRTDGTASGTLALAPWASMRTWGSRAVGRVGNRLLFAGGADLGNATLWISDGSIAGTRVLGQIEQLSEGLPADFRDFNGVTYFRAPSSANGLELWRTDGTDEGTQRVSTASLGWLSEELHGIAAGNRFLFAAEAENAGVELWTHENLQPLASSDSASTSSGASIEIDVVSNDTDRDGSIDRTSVRVLAPPRSGTAQALPEGTVRYTPDAGFSGSDTFSYIVSDNQKREAAPADVTITVTSAATPTPAPPPPASSGGSPGGGGGGALGVAASALLAGCVLFRRRRLQPR